MLNKFRYILRKRLLRNMQEDDIKYEELKKLVNNGAILVDVRNPLEYKEGHIDGAISIPEYELSKKTKEILQDKTQTIIVYCTSGHRSRKAYDILKKQGYQNVYNLYGGLQEI